MTLQEWLTGAAAVAPFAAMIISLQAWNVRRTIKKLSVQLSDLDETVNNGLTDKLNKTAEEVAQIRGHCAAYHNVPVGE
jgi:hypothetical protein